MTSDTLSPIEARHELYAILRQDLSFEEKADQTLSLGKRHLEVQNTHLSRVHPESEFWKIIASTDNEAGDFPPGLMLDLGTTYCRRTVEDGETIALHNAPEQGWANDPAFEVHGLHCDIGTSIILDGETS